MPGETDISAEVIVISDNNGPFSSVGDGNIDSKLIIKWNSGKNMYQLKKYDCLLYENKDKEEVEKYRYSVRQKTEIPT